MDLRHDWKGSDGTTGFGLSFLVLLVLPVVVPLPGLVPFMYPGQRLNGVGCIPWYLLHRCLVVAPRSGIKLTFVLECIRID